MNNDFVLGFFFGIGAAIFVYCVILAAQDLKVRWHRRKLNNLYGDPNDIIRPEMVIPKKAVEKAFSSGSVIDPLMKNH